MELLLFSKKYLFLTLVKNNEQLTKTPKPNPNQPYVDAERQGLEKVVCSRTV